MNTKQKSKNVFTKILTICNIFSLHTSHLNAIEQVEPPQKLMFQAILEDGIYLIIGKWYSCGSQKRHQNTRVNNVGVQWCAMCVCLFLKFYNFIKGIVDTNMIFSKKLKPLFLYLA